LCSVRFFIIFTEVDAHVLLLFSTGEVVEGYEDVVRGIERFGAESGSPAAKIIISDCGTL